MQLIDHERAVLGAILLDNATIEDVADRVAPDDFSITTHRLIFGAMMDRYERGQSIDQLGLYRDLKPLKLKSEGLDIVSISGLMEACPAHTTASHYAEHVREAARFRRLKHEARVLHNACVSGDASEVESTLKTLSGVWETGDDGKTVTLTQAAMEYVKFLERRERGEGGSWDTGIALFDEVCNQGLGGGLMQGQMLICAGRAGAGKTTTALYLVREMMKHNPGLKACFFSLELAASNLGGKVIRSEMDPGVTGNFIGRARESAGMIAETYGDRINIVDHTGMSPLSIFSRARQQAKAGVKVFVIDHLHRVAYPGMQDLRHQIGDFCKRITDFAKDHEALFIVCAQLNRESERLNRDPVMSDLAESGQVEQHADIILAVYPASDMVKGKREPKDGLITFSLLKNRHGPAVSRDFLVSYKHQRISETEG